MERVTSSWGSFSQISSSAARDWAMVRLTLAILWLSEAETTKLTSRSPQSTAVCAPRRLGIRALKQRSGYFSRK